PALKYKKKESGAISDICQVSGAAQPVTLCRRYKKDTSMGRQIVLIADSDQSVRQKLREDIRSHDPQFVFWECSNGREAERYIAALQPDLVFMAVELPGKNGFDVM